MSTEVEFATVTVWFRDPSDGTTDTLDFWELGDDPDAFISNVREAIEDENFPGYEYWLEVESSDDVNGTFPIDQWELEEIIYLLS
jgi:hypothetical protein